MNAKAEPFDASRPIFPHGPVSPFATMAGLSSEELADMRAVAEARALGTKVDPAVVKRVRDRSTKIQDSLRAKFGVQEIAVDLIRQGRDA